MYIYTFNFLNVQASHVDDNNKKSISGITKI